MSDSRITGLYRLTLPQRIDELRRLGWLSAADAELLRQGRHTLLPVTADKMIENVIGVYGLPLGVAPNFVVNGRDYVVPMVVEEASIIAATSSAARLARAGGGFHSRCAESFLIGQIYVSGTDDVDSAMSSINNARKKLLALANAVHPRLTARGGGVDDVEVRRVELDDSRSVIAVHLLVDTCDAMGANLVNTICEALAPDIVELCGGEVELRILSNLTDRSLVTARVRYKLGELASGGFEAAAVRDRIVLASSIAGGDPYRAATHNKGIMNGVDALAIATGNDWRAIEAGAHAYAASTGQYRPLANWCTDDNGDLIGEIDIPLKIGTVGGNLDANASAMLALHIAGIESARELAELMAAVGLAQNFAALRALATSGIQKGHMKLHARSVAASVGVPDELFDEVVAELIDSGEIKVWKAGEILEAKQAATERGTPSGVAAGKIILLGEHGVVYGKHALALPIAAAVSAEIAPSDARSTISIPEWNVCEQVVADDTFGIGAAVALIQKELDVEDGQYAIRLHSRLPRAMGLGSSAALAVAIARAFNASLRLGMDDAQINAVAFECEKLAHGTPSGIDNTISTYGEAMLFRKDQALEFERVPMSETPPIVIASSSQSGLTRQQVENVRARRALSRAHYDAIFAEMDALSVAGAAALGDDDYAELGRLMNICHGLLNAIEVSTPELEAMVSLARAAGASGAKLTGGGGGGSVVALCPDAVAEVSSALESAGFSTMRLV